MLDDIDEVEGRLREMARKCHRTLKHHASMVEVLQRNYFTRSYNVTLAEDVEVEEEGGGSNDTEVPIIENREKKKKEGCHGGG